MSSHLRAEMIRVHQDEIAARTVDSPHAHDVLKNVDRPRRTDVSRIGQTIAALGISLAVTATIAITGAHAKQGGGNAGARMSAAQLEQKFRKLQTEGWVQSSCTRGGSRLHNIRTGEYMTVSW